MISDGEKSDDDDFAILPVASSSRLPVKRPAAPIYINDSASSTASDDEETPGLLDILIAGSSSALHSARTPLPPLNVPVRSKAKGKGKETQTNARLDLLDSYDVGIEEVEVPLTRPSIPSRTSGSLLSLADKLDSPPPNPPKKKKKRKSEALEGISEGDTEEKARSDSAAACSSKEAAKAKLSKEEREAIKAQEKKEKELAKAAAKAAKEAERSFQKKLTDANRVSSCRSVTQAGC